MQNNLKQTYPNAIILLFFFTILLYGFSLPFSLKGETHFSPSNDFSNHAHLMQSFAESFKSGQIIPRTLNGPASFSDGSVLSDGIPTFQYYGFFEGLVALPFHLMGFSSAMAAILSSIIIRFIGLWLLYETCILLGATSQVSFLASFSFLISPYTLSVFYGRGALAESFAQTLLVLIPFGYALACKNQIRRAILTFTMAFFLLPLCHNIFFLYGMLLLAILVLCSFRINVFFCAGLGALIGILLSAWQWLPSEITIKDTTIFGGLNSFKIGAHIQGNDASLSGIFGLPNQYQPDLLANPIPIYYTIGWWSLPFIILGLIALFKKGQRRIAFSFFIAATTFCLLTFPPANDFIYRHFVPEIFAIVQTTSRLLGFVSLLSAISLAIALPKLSSRLVKCLFILIVISQLSVIIFYFNFASTGVWSNDAIKGSPINYYYSNPINDNLIKQSDGTLDLKNRFYINPTEHKQFYIRINGSMPKNEKLYLSVASLTEKPNYFSYSFPVEALLTKPVPIKNDFDVIIPVTASSKSGWYKLFLSPEFYGKKISVMAINKLYLFPDDLTGWIFEEDIIAAKKNFGYSHHYKVKPQVINHLKPDKDGYFKIELPHAYSKLFSVTQNHIKLNFEPDYNHRMVIKTKNLKDEIYVSYQPDILSILLTLTGLLSLLMILFSKKIYIKKTITKIIFKRD